MLLVDLYGGRLVWICMRRSPSLLAMAQPTIAQVGVASAGGECVSSPADVQPGLARVFEKPVAPLYTFLHAGTTSHRKLHLMVMVSTLVEPLLAPSGPVLCVATAEGPIMSLRSDQQSKAALNPSRDGGSRPALQECTCHAAAASVRTFTPLVFTSSMWREV